MIDKIKDESDVSTEVVLAWTINAKYSFNNNTTILIFNTTARIWKKP